MRMKLLMAAAALALSATLSACGPAPKPAEHTLTYASPYPPSHPFSRADQE